MTRSFPLFLSVVPMFVGMQNTTSYPKSVCLHLCYKQLLFAAKLRSIASPSQSSAKKTEGKLTNLAFEELKLEDNAMPPPMKRRRLVRLKDADDGKTREASFSLTCYKAAPYCTQSASLAETTPDDTESPFASFKFAWKVVLWNVYRLAQDEYVFYDVGEDYISRWSGCCTETSRTKCEGQSHTFTGMHPAQDRFFSWRPCDQAHCNLVEHAHGLKT